MELVIFRAKEFMCVSVLVDGFAHLGMQQAACVCVHAFCMAMHKMCGHGAVCLNALYFFALLWL